MNKDLQPHQNDSAPQAPSQYVQLLIIRGSFKEPEKMAQITVLRNAYYGREGWELKDCVAMGLPQQFRFELVRRIERVVKYGIEGYVILI